ncbi:unnamed protein product [Acanthoscelides obtectus]|uniref:Uncharacterized protein n=1 Tax=Acanthoscelides obtectus TaxID=200917 RepID=A0A9P0P5N3_ACAOB|nr:unnamed protein product [Acanthoscelides obtectus]CAK1649324.1 hypothetical protein AOBTE_LOCUS16160 [Acanthoscelides obtectus]
MRSFKNDASLQTVSFATLSNNLDHQVHAVGGHLKSALQKILSIRPYLQGRDKELAEMVSDIKAFIKKLEFWEQHINGDSRHFPVIYKISQSLLEPHDNRS